MRTLKTFSLGFFLFLARAELDASPGVTVYNAGSAVMRNTIPLVLQKGDNDVLAPLISPLLDATSVILRDPTGKADFRIVPNRELMTG